MKTLDAHMPGEEPPRSSMRGGPGRTVGGRYLLLERIGQGAAGEVWRALDTRLRSQVALKLLIPKYLPGEELTRLRFRFEAQVEARLAGRTTHVVAAHDTGHDPFLGSYMVMEYVQGRTLREHLNKYGPMTVDETLTLFEQVAEALGVAHQDSIIHRDLKPSNLLLVDGPGDRIRVKVADFGLAKGLRPDLSMDLPPRTAYGTILGTLSYMSPEQLQGLPVNEQADLWSLAVIVYEALTGLSPFRGDTPSKVLTKLLLQTAPSPSLLRNSLPYGLDGWFAIAFAPEPHRRFRSVQQMLEAFRLAITTRSACETTASQKLRRARNTSWIGTTLLAGAVIMAVGCTAAMVLHDGAHEAEGAPMEPSRRGHDTSGAMVGAQGTPSPEPKRSQHAGTTSQREGHEVSPAHTWTLTDAPAMVDAALAPESEAPRQITPARRSVQPRSGTTAAPRRGALESDKSALF
ncbi:serine/threonine-protein kinase [Chondromyces crocatus]|uniref:serine/threonine-protein kinase n=1 Tax=Chondromyces crocatus TaxID=52 RepID=UPI00067D94BA|nr:serine/threonine-protein kinase [Chondromyces crocatus]